MARNRGIGDWIPAGGEGRALLEVKGKVGNQKGRSMRRFRRGGFRRRANTFWSTGVMSTSPDGAANNSPVLYDLIQGSSGSTSGEMRNVYGFTGTYTGSNDAMTESFKVHQVQGHIKMWAPTTHDLNELDDITTGNSNDMSYGSAPYMVSWFWKLFDDVSANQSIVVPQSMGMQPCPGIAGNDWAAMMRRKDLLSWGHTILHKWLYRHEADYPSSFGLQAAYVSSIYPAPFAFIPRPRIPTRGLRMDRGRALVLMAGILQWDVAAGEWAPVAWTGAAPQVKVQAFLRFLCSK